MHAAFSQNIVADGQTATQIATGGTVTNVTTGTVGGGYGVNSFSQFSVGAGQTVNLHAPAGTTGTINLVNGPHSVIAGTLQGMQNGTHGGALYLANPNGVTVAAGGQVIASRIGLSTPAQAQLDAVFGADGTPDAGRIAGIVNGSAEQSDAGLTVAGAVRATEHVRLTTGGDISISGVVSAGNRAAVVGSAVNLSGIDIAAGGDLQVAGGAQVGAVDGDRGGRMDIRTGGDITLDTGVLVDARGQGLGDGGHVVLFADGSAYLGPDAVVSVAALGAGDGGFVEFSAVDRVTLQGDLQAWSKGGAGGRILIDPALIEIQSTNWFEDGAELHLQALQRIEIAEGVILSTRNVENPDTDNHLTAASEGTSGNLILEAPEIIVRSGAMLLAHGDDTFAGGNILLTAKIDDALVGTTNPLTRGTARIELDGAVLRGHDITLQAEVFKDNILITTSAVSDYAQGIFDGAGIGPLSNLISGPLGQADQAVATVLQTADSLNLPGIVTARAEISVSGSYLVADGDVDISSVARTEVRIAPDDASLAFALSITNTVAEASVVQSQVTAQGSFDLSARTDEVVALVAGGNTGDNADNAAIAVSWRNSRASAVLAGGNFSLPEIDGITKTFPVAYSARDGVSVTALAEKDIALSAASGDNDAGSGQAFVLSVEDSSVAAYVSTVVQTADTDLTITANTVYDRYDLTAVTGDVALEHPDALDSVDSDEVAAEGAAVRSTIANALGLFGLIDGASAIYDRVDSNTTASFGGRVTNGLNPFDFAYREYTGGAFTASDSGDGLQAGPDTGLVITAGTDLGESLLQAGVANDLTDDSNTAGGTVIIADRRHATTADVNSGIVNGGADLELDSTLTGSLILNQMADSGDDVAAQLGWLSLDLATRAQANAPEGTFADVTISAREELEIVNAQDALTTNPNGAGTYGLARTLYASDVVAQVTDGRLFSGKPRPVTVTAQSLSTLETEAVRNGEITGDSGTQAAATGAIMVSSGTVAATYQGILSGSALTVTAHDATWRQTVANASGEGQGTVLVGALAIDTYRRDTLAEVGGELRDPFEDDVTISATSETHATLVSIGRATGDEGFGAAAIGTWLTDDRDVTAQLFAGDYALASDLTVSAQRDDSVIMLQGTDAASDKGAGVALGYLRMGGETRAEVDSDIFFFSSVGEGEEGEEGEEGGGEGSTNAGFIAGDLTITATNATKAINVALGTGTADSFGGAGSLADINMGRLDVATAIDDVTDDLLDTGSARAGTADAALLAAQSNFATEFAELSTLVGTPLSFDLPRAAETIALLDVGGGFYTVGGDTVVEATDLRRATAVAGQLQAGLVSQTIGIVDNYFSIDDISTDGVTFDYLPESLGDVPGILTDAVTTVRKAGSAMVDFADALKEAGSFKTEATTVGGAVASSVIGGIVRAKIDLRQGSQSDSSAVFDGTGAVTVEAINDSRARAVALGVQVGQNGLGASVSHARLNQLTEAVVLGGSLSAQSVDVDATNTGRGLSIAGVALAAFGDAAVGGSVSVTDLDAATLARLSGSAVTTTNLLAVNAIDRSQGLGITLAAGGAVGFGAITGSVTATSQRALVQAGVLGGRAISTTGRVRIEGLQEAVTNGLALQAAGGAQMALGAAIADVTLAGVTEARVDEAEVDAAGDIIVSAGSDRAVGAVAAGASVGGTLGVTGSISLITRAEVTRAIVEDSALTAGDSILVQALSSVTMGAVGGGDQSLLSQIGAPNINLSGGGTVGVGLSISVLRSASLTEALVTEGSVLVANGAPDQTGILGQGRQEITDFATLAPQTYHGIAVVADNITDLNMLAMSASAAGSVAASVQVPVMLVEDAVTAAIEDSTARATAADVAVLAGNQTDLRMLSLLAQGAGTVSGGADVESLSLTKTTKALLEHATVEAARDVTVLAAAPDETSTWSAAASAGGAVAVSGIWQTLRSQSLTMAQVTAGTITADNDLEIAAFAPRKITQNAVNIAGSGTVGVGASVLTMRATDSVIAEVADGTASDHASLTVAHDLTIRATSTLDVTTNSAGGAGAGTVALSGGLIFARVDQTVIARMGAYAEMAADTTDDVVISATQDLDQSAVVGTATGSLVGIGGAVLSLTGANTVLAEIGAQADVSARSDVTVTALANRDVSATTAALGGGFVSFQGAATLVSFGAAASDTETDDTADTLRDDLNNQNAFAGFDAGDQTVSAALAAALAARSSVGTSLGAGGLDAVTVAIGQGATVEAGDDLVLRAEETGDMALAAGGVSGGAVALTGALTRLRSATDVTVQIERNVDLLVDSGTITVEALSEVDTGNPLTLAGGGGIVSGAAGITSVHADRAVSISVGSGVFIGDTAGRDTDVSLIARETGDTTASADGASIGVVAFGGVFSTAESTSTVAINVVGSGAAATIRADTLTITAERLGDVQANGFAASGGLAAGAALDVSATDNSTTRIDLGNLEVANARRVDMTAISHTDMIATATGGSLGGVAAGVMLARAERNASVELTGSALDITADQLTIAAYDAMSRSAATGQATTISVSANAATLAGFGVGGSAATLINNSDVGIDVTFAALDVAGTVNVTGGSNSVLDADAIGLIAGVAALGANKVTLQDTSTLSVAVDHAGAATAGAYNVVTDGRSVLVADVISGTGGVDTASAARSAVTFDATTDLRFDGGAGLVVTGTLDLDLERSLDLSNSGNSLQASLRGFGGTWISNDLDNNSDLEIAGDITAGRINATLTTDITKDDDGWSGRIGSAGLLAGTALLSETDLRTTADIRVEDGAVLAQAVGSDPDAAGITFAVASDYTLTDSVKIDTGGGLALPAAASLIDVNASGHSITIGNADLRAVGAVDLSLTTDAAIATEAFVNVYGIAGVPYAEARTDMDIGQAIVLDPGAQVVSDQSSVMLRAGGDGQAIDLSSEVRVWNATAVPITLQPVAETQLEQDNTITIGNGADVLAGTDVFLNTGAGALTLYSYGLSSDLYREVAEDVANFFGSLVGSDQVSLDTEVGRVVNLSRNGVTVNGRVEAGQNHLQELIIGGNGAVIRATDGITYDIIQNYDPREVLEEKLVELQADLADAAGDAVLETRLAFEIARLEQIIAQLGTGTINLLRITDAFAAPGDVEVTGDYLVGDGDIIANGDATINIINDGSYVVEVVNATIPFRGGGLVMLNGIPVTEAAELADLSGAAIARKPASYDGATVAAVALDVQATASAGEAAETQIAVENRYASATGPTGDLFVTGEISNLRGRVSLFTADGDIMVLGGAIDAATVDIQSGGDFLLSAAYDSAVETLGNAPYASYAPVIAAAQADSCFIDICHDGAAYGYDDVTGGGEIIASGNVYVYANGFVNITGLIQSGITDYQINIEESTNDLAVLLNGIGVTGPVTNNLVTLYSPAGNGTSFGEDINPDTLRPYITGNVLLRYDIAAGVIVADPIVAKGGEIEIVGKIISTGGGTLSAASGYAQIDVVNDSSVDLVLGDLSTGYGEGAEGVIRIVDLSRPGTFAGSGFVQTEYRQAEDGTVTRTVRNTGFGLPQVTEGAPASYAIDTPWRVMLVTGEIADRPDGSYELGQRPGTLEVVVDTFTEVGFLGPSGIIQTGEALISSDVVASIDVTNELVFDANDTAFLQTIDQRFDAFTIGLLSDLIADNDFVKLGNGFLDVNNDTDVSYTPWVQIGGQWTRTRTERTNTVNYDIVTLAADKTIGIDFHGHAAGAISVQSVGDVILNGTIYNRTGPTVIASSAGSILANDAAATVEVNRLELTAAGDIGQQRVYTPATTPGGFGSGGTDFIQGANPNLVTETGLSPWKIDQADGFGLNAVAGGSLRIAEQTGDLLVIRADAAGQLDLAAPGSILTHTNAAPDTPFLTAEVLRLTATTGSLGTLADPLRMQVGTVTGSAGQGINLLQRGDTNLLVRQLVSASGDVTIAVPEGSIFDGNGGGLVDLRAEAGLLAQLWDDLGLRAQDSDGVAESARRAELLTQEAGIRARDYHDYWAIRLNDGVVGSGGLAGSDPGYDPDTVITFTPAQRSLYHAQGLGDVDIDRLIIAQTERYHDLHSVFGAGFFDPGFDGTLGTADTAEVTTGLHRTDAQLRRGLRAALVGGVTDTQLVVEEANIIGTNINLLAGNNIGRNRAPLVIDPAQGLTDQALLDLWTAERQDITIDAGVITVARVNDLDVTASGDVIAVAGENIYLGSEELLRLRAVQAAGDVRITSANGLAMAGPGLIAPLVSGLDLVLEGGAGSVGALGAPMLAAQSAGGSLVARAAGDVRISAPTGDLRVNEVFSPNAVVLTALSGALVDGNSNAGADIIGGDIVLFAADRIGAVDNALDVAMANGAGTLSAVAMGGNLTLDVVTGDVTAGLIGSVSANTRLRVLGGDLVLAGLSDQTLAALVQATPTPVGGFGAAAQLPSATLPISNGTFAAGILNATPGSSAQTGFLAGLLPQFSATTPPTLGFGTALGQFADNGAAVAAAGFGGLLSGFDSATQGDYPALPAIRAGATLFLDVAGDVTGRAGPAIDMAAVTGAEIAIGGAFGSAQNYIVTQFDNGDNMTAGATLALRDLAPGGAASPSVHLANIGALEVTEALLDRGQSAIRVLSLGDLTIADNAQLRGGVMGFAALPDNSDPVQSDLRLGSGVQIRADRLVLLAEGEVQLTGSAPLDLDNDLTILADRLLTDAACTTNCGITLQGDHTLRIATRSGIELDHATVADGTVVLTSTDLGTIDVGSLTARTGRLTTNLGDVKLGTATMDDLTIRANGALRPATLNVSGDLDISALAIGDSAMLPVIINTATGHGPMQLSGDLGVMVTLNGALAYNLASVMTGASGLGVDILATSTGLGALSLGSVASAGANVSIVADQINLDGNVTSMGGDVTLRTTEGAFRQAIGTRVDAGTGHIAVTAAGDMRIAELYSYGTDPTRAMITLSTPEAITGLGTGPHVFAAITPDATVSIGAGAIANAGTLPFWVDASRLAVSVGGGDLHLFTSLGSTTVTNLRNIGGGTAALSAMGDVVLDAAFVQSRDIFGTAKGDVVVTSFNGGISGTVGLAEAGHLYLHAFGGQTATDGIGLAVTTAAVDLLSAGAVGAIDLSFGTDSLVGAYVVSEGGAVTLSAPDAVTVPRLGAGGDVLVTAGQPSVSLLAQGTAQPTLPATVGLINPPGYRTLTAGLATDGGTDVGTGGGTGGGFVGTGLAGTSPGGGGFASGLLIGSGGTVTLGRTGPSSTGATFGAGSTVVVIFEGLDDDDEQQVTPTP